MWGGLPWGWTSVITEDLTAAPENNKHFHLPRFDSSVGSLIGEPCSPPTRWERHTTWPFADPPTVSIIAGETVRVGRGRLQGEQEDAEMVSVPPQQMASCHSLTESRSFQTRR